MCAPLSWHPRLRHGTDAESANWRLIGNGVGVHYWPDLDEDIGVEGWVLGKRSREGGVSLAGWLAKYVGTSPEFWLNLQMRCFLVRLLRTIVRPSVPQLFAVTSKLTDYKSLSSTKG